MRVDYGLRHSNADKEIPMKALMTLAFAAMMTLGMSSSAIAHCGSCGPKDVTSSCKKKCADAKDKKACNTKCKKKHDADHKKEKKGK